MTADQQPILPPTPIDRRDFVRTVGTGVAAASVGSTLGSVVLADDAAKKPAGETPESLVRDLYASLNDKQRDVICFDWDHTDKRGLLRLHVENNWQITQPKVNDKAFFTADQIDQIEAIFFGLYHPDWHDRIRKQLRDDAGGYGRRQSIAIFGEPGTGKFEFVMTGRHLTARCDGDSTPHTAFGGPIFYGHAAQDFVEAADHPGNVFWSQALAANKLYEMFDGKQQKEVVVPRSPVESRVHFQGKDAELPGLPVSEFSDDQKAHLEMVLASLIEPYRESDRAEVRKCLAAQGGLEKCSLAFYAKPDIGNDKVWDNWRLEGPSFVWYFRGAPHVHVWVNIADDPSVKVTTAG